MKRENVKLLLVGSLAALAGIAAWNAAMWVTGYEWIARGVALAAWLLTLALSGMTLEALDK